LSYELIFDESYLKKEKKFFKKHPNLIGRYAKALHILSEDPDHPSLRLHKLQGKLQPYYSISITMQYRVVIDIVIEADRIYFLDIGGHEVYR
jgi:addiction module RelE/StbE family toxin